MVIGWAFKYVSSIHLSDLLSQQTGSRTRAAPNFAYVLHPYPGSRESHVEPQGCDQMSLTRKESSSEQNDQISGSLCANTPKTFCWKGPHEALKVCFYGNSDWICVYPFLSFIMLTLASPSLLNVLCSRLK